MKPKSAVPGYLVAGVGLALIAAGAYWGFVVGYYPNELPMLLGLLIAGMLLAWAGQRMLQSVKRHQAELRIAQRDSERKK